MGGIPTNHKTQVLDVDYSTGKERIVEGLWAIGEAASVSVHGANRLGSNSLLELVVFGKACAENIAEIMKPGEMQRDLLPEAGDNSLHKIDHYLQVAKTGKK